MSAAEKSLNTQILKIHNDNIGIYHNAFYSKELDSDEKESIWYVSIWKAITKYKKGKANFTTFLWNIFKNDCITYIRKKRNNDRIPFQVAVKDEIYPVYDNIEDYTFSLTKREKEILHYRFVDCMTYQEIGEKFSISRERVRQIAKKAIGELKCYMN